MSAQGAMRAPTQYAKMGGSIAGRIATPSAMKMQSAVNAPRSFFGQAPNVMTAHGGKSVAAQAMHQKYSAQSGAGRVPTMMMG